MSDGPRSGPAVDLRLVPAAAATWAAAAALVPGGWRTAAGAAVGCALVTALLVRRGTRRATAGALVATAVALVAGSCALRLADRSASPLTDAAERRTVAALEVTVARDARTFTRHGSVGSVVVLTVHRAQWRDGWFGGRDRVVAFLDGPSSDLVVGRSLTVQGRLGPSDTTDVVAALDVSRRGPSHAGAWWWQGAAAGRAAVREASAHTGRDPSALVPALVDGDDAGLRDVVRDDFERAGLTHLLAVSGTNLTIVLAVVLACARAARAGPRTLVVVGLLAVGAFVLLARPDPSVVRAAGMGVVGLAALGLGSRGGLRALAVAVVALLAVDPWLSRTPGFVLSVVATAGILVGTAPIADRLGRWMPRGAALAVAVPTAAQLACTPVIAALSGQVSLVAVLANVLAAPAVAPTTVAGLVGGVLCLVADPLGRPAGTVAGLGARWILLVGRTTASLDGASLPWAAPWWLLLVLVPVVALALVRLAGRPALLGGLVLGLALCLVRPPQPGWPPSGWVVVACDVGQGDATVLRSGPGEAVVVDVGPDARALDRCLDALGVRRVRLVVLTHAHADHVDGWEAVAHRRPGRVVVGPSGGARVRAERVSAGTRIAVGEVRLEVLAPEAGTEPPAEADGSGEGSAVNDASLVVRATVRGTRVLLTGDVEPAAQDAVLRAGRDVAADVLKMPHHGSARQSRRFVEAVGARVATVSAGRDNDYGHPAAAALTLLREVGTTWRRTDLDGDVAVVVRSGRLGLVTRSSGPAP